MSEKIITEFSLRLNKARNQLTEVNNHCVTLKKEAGALKKQLDESTQKRDQALKSQEALRLKYITSRVSNVEENQKFQQDQQLLNDLRKKKRKLLKDKEIAERETDKVKVEYDQLVKDRLELEEVAKSLSQRLEQSKAEKLALEEQLKANEDLIEKAGEELVELKEQHKNMKSVIASTLEEDLHTSLTPSPEKVQPEHYR